MTNIYSFDGIVVAICLVICSCTYIRYVPFLRNLLLSEHKGFLGTFYKVNPERLQAILYRDTLKRRQRERAFPHCELVQQAVLKKAFVCKDAVDPSSKNHRRNTSVMLRWQNSQRPPHNPYGTLTHKQPDNHDGEEEAVDIEALEKTAVRTTNILIDCGKSFRQSALHVLAPKKIRYIDACIITHEHADAMLGLDDLRDWTAFLEEKYELPVWVWERDMPSIARTFPYLVERATATGSGFVGSLRFHTFASGKAFQVLGLDVLPLEVCHGKTYTCCGFLIGKIAYISDCSGLPDDVVATIRCRELDVLVLDAIAEEDKYSSHFHLDAAVEAIRQVRPKVAYLTGMSHYVNHDTWERKLRAYEVEGLDIRMSYDGLDIPVDLGTAEGRKE